MKQLKTKDNIDENDLEIRIMINDNCNLNCSYCISNSGPTKTNTFTKHNELFNFIKGLSFNNLVITFSGGEPLLEINNIMEILAGIQKIVKNKLIVNILTNGTLILEKIGKLYILNKMYNLNIIISAHRNQDMLALPRVEQELRESNIKFMSRKPIDSINTLNKIIINDQLNDVDEFFPTFNSPKVLEIMNNTIPDFEKGFVWYDGKRYYELNQYEIYQITNFNFKNWECNSGKDLICINTDGKVFPCSIYFHDNLTTDNSNVEMKDYKQEKTICQKEECWCFTSCRTLK